MTLAQYVAQMSANKARFVRALDATTITSEETQVLERLGATRRVMVITEDWCGTSLAEVPCVAKMVEGNPNVEMRIFLRDANPDLMDQYLKQGLYRAVHRTPTRLNLGAVSPHLNAREVSVDEFDTEDKHGGVHRARDRRELRRRRDERPAGADRLLGAVVRPLPRRRAGARRARP